MLTPRHRALTLTELVRWDGRTYLLGIEFGRDGRPLDVRLTGARTGAEMEALADDACALISGQLQRGAAPGDLDGRLHPDGAAPASLIGAVVRHLATVAPALADPVRLAYACAHGAGRG